MGSGKLHNLQSCRALAAWMVVLYHAATILGKRLPAAESLGLGAWRAFGFAGVDLFFVISGVVMVVTCRDRLGDGREVVPFLKRRLVRIYPLYWLATLAVLAAGLAAPALMQGGDWTMRSVAKSLLLWPQREFPVVSSGWTLSFEVYFYLVFAALVALPRRSFPWALVAWAAATVAYYALLEKPEQNSILANLATPLPASPLVLEFIAGCGVGWLLAGGAARGGRTVFACGLAGVAAGAVATMQGLVETASGMPRVAIFGSAAVALVYGAVAMETSGRRLGGRGAQFWGDASYSLYLTHVYVVLAAAALLKARPLQSSSTATSAAILVLALAACAAVAATCYRWVERPLLAASRRLARC